MKKMIEHVALRVTDLNRSIAFYRDIMGFTPIGRRKIGDGEVEQVVFRVGDDVLVLFHSESFSPEPISSESGHISFSLDEKENSELVKNSKISTQSGVDHISFSLDEKEYFELIKKLKMEGIKIHRGEVKNLGAFGVGYATYFFDPDNIQLEIKRYEDPPEQAHMEWYET